MKRLVVLLAFVVGCGGGRASQGPGSAPEPPPRLLKDIEWVHDDYAAALQQAKARKVPIVIDMWAPWCHTCLSMQHYVLEDPSFRRYSDRFVWLAVDTDKPENAGVVGKFPPAAWPTFFVVSPLDESVQARQVGSTSVAQFRAFLDDGEAGHLDRMRSGGLLAEGSVRALLRQGDQAATAKRYGDAERAYRQALSAPDLGAREPQVYAALISALYKGRRYPECIELGLDALPKVAPARSAISADFAFYAFYCATKAKDEPGKKAVAKAAIPVMTELVEDSAAPLSADDRSDALRILREMHLALGDKERATELARRQRAVLNAAVAEAKEPIVRMTYAWPQCEVYHYLGDHMALAPELEALAKALPGEYDPAYRLGWLLLKADKPAEALPWATKALALVYGPRAARVQMLVADIHAALGDKAAERAAREAVVRIYEELPEGQQNPAGLEAAKAALAKMAPPES